MYYSLSNDRLFSLLAPHVPCAAIFSIIPYHRKFVKRNVEKNCTKKSPKICAFCMLIFVYINVIMYLQGKEREVNKMTVGMIIFLIVIFIWLFFGFMMIVRMNEEGVNWCGFVFLFVPPFLPLVAKMCGML